MELTSPIFISPERILTLSKNFWAERTISAASGLVAMAVKIEGEGCSVVFLIRAARESDMIRQIGARTEAELRQGKFFSLGFAW